MERTPSDAAIWVQLGHALNEQSDHGGADEAYRRAIKLRPDSADALLHLGRVLVVQGRVSEARDTLLTSLGIQVLPETYRALVEMGETEAADEVIQRTHPTKSTTNRIIYDVTDLLNYLRAHQTLSGIQRVQANIIERLLEDQSEATHTFAVSKSTGGETILLMLEPRKLAAVVNYATSASVSHEALRSLIDKCDADILPLKTATGQTYFILGAFWGSPVMLENCRRLKKEGLFVGVYIYDLIPVSHPEFCDWRLAFDFAMTLGDALPVFDFIFTISEHVAGEVRKLLARTGIENTPVQAIPLAHTLKPVHAMDLKRLPSPPTKWPAAISKLEGRSFVLFVSTIEARKNHAYVVRAWRELMAAGAEVPDLVFVGRPGWRVDDLMAQLRDTANLDGKVHILHDISDTQLSTLYENCLFTVFPSFVEGWGLPVGESLAHGAPCVASSTSSIPEVGGKLVDYVDPLNLREGLEVLKKMMFDHSYRAKRKESIATHFRARDWQEVASHLTTGILNATRSHAPRALPVPHLHAAEFFAPRRFSARLGQPLPASYLARPLRSLLDHGWFGCEDFGVWMRGEQASIVFSTGIGRAAEIQLFMQIVGAPHSTGQTLTMAAQAEQVAQSVGVAGAKPEAKVALVPGVVETVRIAGRSDEKGLVVVTFKLDSPAEALSDDPRRFSSGLIHLAWAEKTDVLSRQEIVEALLYDLPASN